MPVITRCGGLIGNPRGCDPALPHPERNQGLWCQGVRIPANDDEDLSENADGDLTH